MAKPKVPKVPVFYKISVVVVFGAILGWLLDRWLSKQAWNAVLVEGVLSTQDVIELVLGGGLMVFGGRIHSSLRYLGLGIFSYEVSRIAAEQIFKATGM